MGNAVACFLLFFVVVACSSSQSNTPPSREPSNAGLPAATQPENSRITGRIVTLLDSILPVAKGHPCAQHPCVAWVAVENVDQKGSNYHGQFNPGDTVLCRFTYTLSPTHDLFPALTPHLPGLQPQDRFQSDVKWEASSGLEVLSYKKLKP